MTGRAALEELTAATGSPEAARWILAEALGVGPAALAAAPAEPVPEAALAAARRMAARRAGGEPLQHVLGSWGFRRLDVLCDRRALVPRPETEVVVEVALEHLAQWPPAPGALVAADLGTGSGVIALSLAAEGPATLEVWATERSPAALELARANLERVARDLPASARRVRMVAGSWFEPLPGRLRGELALVVSNPPYVSASEWATLDPEVRDHDPYEALVAGPSGLEALGSVLGEAPAWLAPGGAAVVEIAPHQAGEARSLAARLGYVAVEVRPDLAGRDRVLVGRRP
ncbi:MAG: peptide chain release factor N(5)-glutamine methyltransferase, partial [Acidobacteriota bacterium]|nr:peptide chain release factor N(5)-glutamine methyltransferase [Acidobacteriota bacterium]